MWCLPRFSCVAMLLPALLLLWCGAGTGGGQADAAPTLGLLNLFSTSNGTNLITELLLDHVEAKINKLETIADFLAIIGNSTSSG